MSAVKEFHLAADHYERLLEDAQAELEAARAENIALKNALRPFARLGAWCWPGWVDADTSWCGELGSFRSDPEPPTVGDLRRAWKLSA